MTESGRNPAIAIENSGTKRAIHPNVSQLHTITAKGCNGKESKGLRIVAGMERDRKEQHGICYKCRVLWKDLCHLTARSCNISKSKIVLEF